MRNRSADSSGWMRCTECWWYGTGLLGGVALPTSGVQSFSNEQYGQSRIQLPQQ